MTYAFLPHLGSIWLCETDGPQVKPLAPAPGGPHAEWKFSTEDSEFGFRRKAGKKIGHIGHYRLLAQAPWFECLTPPTALPKGCVADDFVINDGMLIAGVHSKTSEALWVHSPGAEQPWVSIPLPVNVGVRGTSIKALFVRDHTLVAIDNRVMPNRVLLYELSPSLRVQGAENVELIAHDSYERFDLAAEGTGVYAILCRGSSSSSYPPDSVSVSLSLLCAKSLREQVLWRETILHRPFTFNISAFLRTGLDPQAVKAEAEPIPSLSALFDSILGMAFCGDFLLLASGSKGLQVSDAAFERNVKFNHCGVAIGNPFFPVHLQRIKNVQRLECPREQSLGIYVIGLNADDRMDYEWLGIEQLSFCI
jgi:hypothetical protein